MWHGSIWVQTVTWGWCISENPGTRVLRLQEWIVSPHPHFTPLLHSVVPFPSSPGHVTPSQLPGSASSHAGSAFPGEWAVLCSKNLPLGASRVTKALNAAGSFPCRVQTRRLGHCPGCARYSAEPRSVHFCDCHSTTTVKIYNFRKYYVGTSVSPM